MTDLQNAAVVEDAHIQSSSIPSPVFPRKDFGIKTNSGADSANKKALHEHERIPEDCTEGFIDIDSLEHILSYLNTSDLKSCREVSLTWNSIATKFLLKRGSLKMSFFFNYCTDTFEIVQKPRRTKPNMDLASLMDWLADSPDLFKTFPTCEFSFVDGYITHSSVQEFLSQYGNSIKCLRIDISCEIDEDLATCMNDIEKLLIVYSPNLEALQLGQFPLCWNQYGIYCEDWNLDTSDREPCALTYGISNLPKLKSLEFLCPAPIKVLEVILVPAKNLKNLGLCLSDGNISSLNWLIEHHRIHLLQSLEIAINMNWTDLGNQQRLSKLKLNLKKLIIYLKPENQDEDSDEYGYGNDNEVVENEDDDNNIGFDGLRARQEQACRILENFIKSNAETLQVLHIEPVEIFAFLEFPYLPTVKTMEVISIDNDLSGQMYFPIELKLFENFSAIESYKSHAHNLPDVLIGDLQWSYFYGDSTEPLDSVKKVSFRGLGSPPLEWIQNFPRYFPNLTTVQLGHLANFPLAAQAFWKLSMLQKLEFLVNINEGENAFPALDMGFTGVSKKVCKRRVSKSSEDLANCKLDGLRNQGSLLDATNLRELHFTICDLSDKVRVYKNLRSISHIAGLFAFKMCPKIHATISIFAHNKENRQILASGMNTVLASGMNTVLPFVESITDCKQYP